MPDSNLCESQDNMKTEVEIPAVVLITGALTGIGRATAVEFAKEGAHIVVAGRHDEESGKLAAELRKFGAEAEYIRAHVLHETDIKSLVDRAVAPFGHPGLAVHNAGPES